MPIWNTSICKTSKIYLLKQKLQADILKGFKIGADDYITKPFKPSELVQRVKEVLSDNSDWADREKF